MSFSEKIKEKLKRGRDFLIAEPEIVEQRISLCNSCEHLSGLRNCKRCGCFVDAKTILKNTNCPVGKW